MIIKSILTRKLGTQRFGPYTMFNDTMTPFMDEPLFALFFRLSSNKSINRDAVVSQTQLKRTLVHNITFEVSFERIGAMKTRKRLVIKTITFLCESIFCYVFK